MAHTSLASPQSLRQKQRFDRQSQRYKAARHAPPSQRWQAYHHQLALGLLDRNPPEAVSAASAVLELCCGEGTFLQAFSRTKHAASHPFLLYGVDISRHMFPDVPSPDYCFVQADAVALPFPDGFFTVVLVDDGLHHVPALDVLLRELHRVLTPGGLLLFHEPVDDWLPWRLARRLIYRWSSQLDPITEHPLRRRAFQDLCRIHGFHLHAWETSGFAGHAVSTNSHVLVFNRLLDRLPGSARLTDILIRLDAWCLRLPFLRHAGIKVSGLAVKATPQALLPASSAAT